MDKLYTQLTDKEKARVKEAGDTGLTSGPTIQGFTYPVDEEKDQGLHELTPRGQVYYKALEQIYDYPSAGNIRPYVYAFGMLAVIVGCLAVVAGVVSGACSGVFAVLFSIKEPLTHAYLGAVVGAAFGGGYALVWCVHKMFTEWSNWNRDFK